MEHQPVHEPYLKINEPIRLMPQEISSIKPTNIWVQLETNQVRLKTDNQPIKNRMVLPLPLITLLRQIKILDQMGHHHQRPSQMKRGQKSPERSLEASPEDQVRVRYNNDDLNAQQSTSLNDSKPMQIIKEMNESQNINPISSGVNSGLQQSYSSQQYSAMMTSSTAGTATGPTALGDQTWLARKSENLRGQSRSRGQISQKSTDKYNDCESGANANPTGLINKPNEEPFSGSATPNKQEEEQEQAEKNTGFQFVSFKIEPSKNQQKTMKKRDKNKPLIDDSVIKRQINFQNKLIQYQRHVNFQSIGIDLEDMNKSSNQNQKPQQQQMIRGNMGFCPLDMSLINLGGVPSLWMNPKEYCSEGSYIQIVDSLGKTKTQFMPYIKPFQRKLMKKQYKLYELLRFHKLFENEKYFGRTNNQIINQQFNGMFQDYYFFSTDFLKDGNHSKNQITQLQSQWEITTGKSSHTSPSLNAQSTKQGILKEKSCALNIIQSSADVIQPELPLIVDSEPAYFKLINSESKILKSILQSQNITQTDQNEWNILWTCISLQNKQNIYETMQDHQKINHFQFSTELTRKDRFAENIQRMKNRYGFSQFDFAPETYQLPEQQQMFMHRFQQIQEEIIEDSYTNKTRMTSTLDSNHEEQAKNNEKADNMWIVKPTQSSQGKGIYLMDDMNELNLKDDRAVICKYISNPLLVNNHKFDLRIYVLVTCIDPLRIYIYNEGLARFASEPYDSAAGANAKKNLYQHLTNYSINKKSDNFSQNKSVLERDHGNKWSLSALQTHLEKMGVNMQVIWERIYDAIIKSIISVEHHLQQGTKKFLNSSSRSNCFELFGFDILLDTNFKPHILEVNFSPSLSADSPLDYHIKSNLLIDTLNIVGIKRNQKRRGKNISSMGGGQRYRAGSINQVHNLHMGQGGSLGFIQLNQILSKSNENQNNQTSDGSAPQRSNSRTEMRNFTSFLNGGNIDQYFLDRLSRISAKHREQVFETLDEFQRNRNLNYTCIYPAPGCHLYDKYFETPRNSNQLIHRYLFSRNELYTLTKQITEYQRQAQAILNSAMPNIIKKDITKMNQDLDSPLNEVEDPHEDDLSEDNMSEKSNESDSGDEKNKKPKTEQTPKKKAENSETIKSSSAKKDKEKSEELKETDSAARQKEEDAKVAEKKITIESRHVEVTRVISDSIDQSSVSKASDTSELVKNKSTKNLSTSNVNAQVTKREPNSSITTTSPPPLDIKKEPNSLVLSELKNVDIDVADINISPSHQKKNQRNTTVEKKENVSKTVGKEEKTMTEKSQDTIDSPLKPQLPDPVDISNDNDCNSPEITIYTKNQKLTKSNSLVDDSKDDPAPTADDSSAQQLMGTINEKDQPSNSGTSSKDTKEEKKEKQKMIITGDDILIEYVQRIISILDNILAVCKTKCGERANIEKVDDIIPQQMKFVLETFVRHKIWSNKFTSVEDSFSLVKRLKLRHHEMVERRSKILRSTMKKQDANITKEAILEVINQQDQARDKIVSRISSQKIEKMVKQSNIENQIDIVRVLIEGNFTLPNHLQTSTGKKLIKGTLQSLKVFEKILRSQNDIVYTTEQSNLGYEHSIINRSVMNNPINMIQNPSNIQDVLNSNSGLGQLLKNNNQQDGSMSHNFAAFQVQNHKFKNSHEGAEQHNGSSAKIQPPAGQKGVIVVANGQVPQEKKFYRSTVINQKQINYLQKRVDDNDGFVSNMALSANSSNVVNPPNINNNAKGKLTIENQDINIRLGSRSHQKKSQSFINMQDQNTSQVVNAESSVEAPSPQLNKLKNNRISSLIIQQRQNPTKESRNSYQQRTHQQETDTQGGQSGQSFSSGMYLNNQSALSQNRQIQDQLIMQTSTKDRHGSINTHQQINSASNHKEKKYISFSNVYQDDNLMKAANGAVPGPPAATNAFSPQIQKNNVIRLDRCMSKFRVVSNSSNQQMGMVDVNQNVPFKKQTTQKFEHQKSTDSPSKYFTQANMGGISSSDNPHRNSESRSMHGANNYYQNRNVNNLQQQLFMSNNNNDGYNSEFTAGYGNYTLKNQNSQQKQNNMQINTYTKNNRMLSFDSARRGTEISQTAGGIKNFTQDIIQANFGPQTMSNQNKGQIIGINSTQNSGINSAALSQQDMSQSMNKGITLPKINQTGNIESTGVNNRTLNTVHYQQQNKQKC